MRYLVGASILVGMCTLGCEPEVGKPCDSNQNGVLELVNVEAGTNDLVRHPLFENCTQRLCASTDGARPYCTKACESDIECAEAGEGFTCQVMLRFGVLGCTDYVPPDECSEEAGCDCMGPDGVISEAVIKYCGAPPEVIAKRDQDFGRPPFEAPVD